ncbi:MAG TPA: hypothetical protein PKA29_00645 [Candidatus Saccharibacteria bacterium]|jgi:23S rRNA (uracil1939-C5)-methyltransferase|nr:hypothetical protein [Candidatus Saccharibacteria bacterium]
MRRNRNKNLPIIKLKGEKFVGGGQVMAHNEDGKPVFIWGILPGELATVQLTKRKKDYAEGVVAEVIEPSESRIQPSEPEYLSTSPWQILAPELEDTAKLNILQEQFEREGIKIKASLGFQTEQFFNYRNKMEYCFWADDDGLNLSLRKRGTNQKIVVSGSALAQKPINDFSSSLITALNSIKSEGRQLKSVIIRCSNSGSVSSALFVKDENFQAEELITKLKQLIQNYQWGIEIYFSEPKSPASVPTKLITSYGSTVLEDEISGIKFKYSSLSFFQGNINAYQKSLSLISTFIDYSLPLVDMFSGVGSIGISLAEVNQKLSLIEIDDFNTKFAKLNSSERSENTTDVITNSSEEALEHILKDINLILDPPRAGLHKNLTAKICEVKPKKVVYLSCNPATQARDIKLMVEAGYKIKHGPVMFNFFPRTPHIESLVVLET